MEKLSGLVLDAYDDASGDVMRAIFPSLDGVPSIIKEAHFITPEERRELPDEVFALILHDGEVSLQKYACTDAGNTALSVEYFLKTAHKLPVEAQQVAAENLVTACGWYGIEPPESLTKVALGLGTALNLMAAPGVIKGTKAQVSQNMAVAKASGGGINPNTLTFKPTAGGES